MDTKIAVIGLGYVGLPLAVEFGKNFSTVGYDININRINELKDGFDTTKELNKKDILASNHLQFTSKIDDLADSTVYIITVPTPIDEFKKPNLKPLISASSTVGSVLNKGDIVIYESTVYPGCTEEDCVPILEEVSGLSYNVDFFCGYSPERINPGDKIHTVTKIKKVTSGSTEEISLFVDNLYSSIIEAGTFRAKSIRVAEAAKVIENCQRDINIAFVNELALLFEKMNIDTLSVLEAAGTKWNFLPFKPGLVGGHCIGVDPYYLTYKAESLGYHPEVILSGRRINDNMGKHVASELVKLLIKTGSIISSSKVLVLGITFKENCPDIRNTRVIDIIHELSEYGCLTDVYDPWADRNDVHKEYGLELHTHTDFSEYQGIILAVNHSEFLSNEFLSYFKDFKGVIYDVKGSLPNNLVDKRL